MDAPILRFDRYTSCHRHSLPLGRKIWLEITRGQVQKRIRPVRGPLFLIGSATDCDLVLGDSSFPEAYAYVFVQEAAIVVRRLGLGPELQVAGEAVETAELRDGDPLSFGPFELRLHVEEDTIMHELPAVPTVLTKV
jgi:hypothetical protein